MNSPTLDVLIIGGGLAGLTCACYLSQKGVSFRLLEASDDIGGRARTDEMDGFLLDRGFQVFLTSYPEAQQLLDYNALELRRFHPGAWVRMHGEFHPMSDPWRSPVEGVKTLFSPIGSILDKVKIARMRERLIHEPMEALFKHPETDTLSYLQQEGFSSEMINRFFRPFIGGVFLESDLATSSRMFEFVFRLFSTGDASVPARGMGAIARQLSDRLPPDSIRTHSRVVELLEGGVRMESGETLFARQVVLATDAYTAHQLCPEIQLPPFTHTTCLYYAAATPPVREPILLLNGDNDGIFNNLTVMSQVAPSYAPDGQALISVSVLGIPDNLELLEVSVRQQLREWFGTQVSQWRLLKTYPIRNALPFAIDGRLDLKPLPAEFNDKLLVCGDHRDTASINGAMASGRRAAEAILERLAATVVSS
jgi:phytoene dehydrogenase-like protein